MRVWIVTVGEPLPFDPGNPRLLRAGILARMMAGSGHDVTWWNSTVIHSQKTLRFNRTTEMRVDARLNTVSLHGGLYTSNISIARIWNHIRVAAAFWRHAKDRQAPDLILCSMPTVELCAVSALLKKRFGARLVIDIRDNWPDIWVEAAPAPFKPLVTLAIQPWQWMLSWSLSKADRVIGFTDKAVDWAFTKMRRKRTAQDIGVPMAYEIQVFSDDVLERARYAWDGKGVTSDCATICMIGTLTSRFSNLMLDAIAALRMIPVQNRRKIRLVFAGAGEAAAKLKAAAADMSEVVFPGWIGAPDIQVLMERSCGGLLPYPNTDDFLLSFPNKSIEYLAGGLPIITCLKGQIGALIAHENCGFTYEQGDVAGLAAVFTQVLDNPGLFAEKGRRSKALYERRFTPERLYGDLIAELEKTNVMAANNIQEK